MNLDEDQQLVAKIALGDSQAFGLLLDKYQDLVYGLSLKLVKNATLAEDMTQETWMRVIKSADKYSPIGSVKSWILQINRNLIMDYFRVNKKWSQSEDIDEIDVADDAETAFEMMESEENKKIFDSFFSRLPERDKVVLTMVILEEKSYAEISKVLNLSVGAVKTIVFRSKKLLQSQISEIKTGGT